MDPSLYGDLVQLEYLIASDKPAAAHCVTTKSSKDPGAPFVSPAGLYQEEESVDFSALVEACELNNSPHLTTGSATFLDPSDSAFPFDTELLPTATSTASLSMFSTENGSSAQLDLLTTGRLTPAVSQSSIVLEMPTSTTNSVGTTATAAPKCGSKRKPPEKGSHEYREKRDRNNLAVKKSRSKSKMKIKETEERVKELEDENSRLQNKIALLSKELNVLKSLFSSAGVPQPATLNTLDSTTE